MIGDFFELTPLGSQIQEEPFPGCELFLWKIQFSGIKKINNQDYFIIPHIKSLKWYFYVLYFLSQQKENYHFIFDFPIEAKDFIGKILKTSPTPLLLIKNQENLKNSYFFDGFDLRRLSFLLNSSLEDISILYSQENTLQNKDFFTNEPPDFGLLPWLEEKLHDISQKTNSQIPSLYEIKKSIIIICKPENLYNLYHHITNNHENVQYLSFHQNTKAMIYEVESSSASDLSLLPGFFLKDIVSSFQGKTLPSSWKDLWEKSLQKTFEEATEDYKNHTKIDPPSYQKKQFLRFITRLAKLSYRLIPNNFDLLLASQATIDSNFASFLTQKVSFHFPPTGLEIKSLDLSQIFPYVDSFQIRKFSTLQSFRNTKLKLQEKKEKKAGKIDHGIPIDENKYKDDSWVYQDQFDICTYPDEDIHLDEFSLFYRNQMKEQLKAKEMISRPMEGSLLDGIDIRETVRSWHKEVIMVKEELKIGKADIGSVIVQFEPSSNDIIYSWKMFLNAEEHDLCDLMFYSTPYEKNIIGPGIAQSSFGGFCSIPLPNFIRGNIWNDPFLQNYCKSSSDMLLLCGAFATDHKYILHISHEKASSHISNIIKRSGKIMIHLPINEIPHDKIKNLKTFHILAEKGVRTYAKKYIKKEY